MGKKILILEDEAIVALDLAMQLEDEGHMPLGPAGTPEEAIALLEEEEPDFAVLDVNLDGITSKAVAEQLTERGCPFVYVTGYADEGIMADMPCAPSLSKPLDFTRLKRLIDAQFDQSDD